MNKRLERLPTDSVVGGVASGLADYFKIDRTLVRVLFVAGIFLPHVPALLIYLILWAVLPARMLLTSPSTSFSTMHPTSNHNDENTGSIAFGGLLILIGIYYFLREWFDFYVDFGKIWPVALILFGVWLLVRGRYRTRSADRSDAPSSFAGSDDPAAPRNPQQPL